MTTINVTPDTAVDVMAALVGKRVEIDRSHDTVNSHAGGFQRGTITRAPWHTTICPGVGADILEDAHGSCRGGNTATFIPYGSTVRVITTSEGV